MVGEQWLGALKNIDYSNRLPRGASYARNGMVQEIKFLGNIIRAKVKGSRLTPYSETIKLLVFADIGGRSLSKRKDYTL